MRRLLLAFSLVTVGVAAVSTYALAFRERAFGRYIAEGEAALNADQTLQAIEAFSGALVLKSGAMLPYLKRGETYLKRGDVAAALRDLRKAADIDPMATRPLELLGDANYTMQRYARAAEHYLAYTKLDDRSSRVLHKLALALYRNGDVAGAIAPLRQVVALEPEAAEPQYLLGVCLRDGGDLREARRVLEQAIATAPDLTEAREELADLHLAQGRRDLAIAQLEALATIDPSQHRRTELGIAYAAAGRTELAIGTIRRAAEQPPAASAPNVALGRVWLTVAEAKNDGPALAKALEALRTAVGGGSATSEALTLLGRALLAEGDRDQAEAVLRRATDTYPVDPDAFAQYAEALLRRDEVAGAREALVKHHALLPPTRPYPILCERIAELSTRLDDWRTAAIWLRKIAMGSDNPDVLLRLAEAEWRSGDSVEAQKTTARALASHRGHKGLITLTVRMAAIW